jgi:hypothetical protein
MTLLGAGPFDTPVVDIEVMEGLADDLCCPTERLRYWASYTSYTRGMKAVLEKLSIQDPQIEEIQEEYKSRKNFEKKNIENWHNTMRECFPDDYPKKEKSVRDYIRDLDE